MLAGDKPAAFAPKQRLERLWHRRGGDAFQIKNRNQVLDARGAPQIRRKDPTGETFVLPSVIDARRLHFNRPEPSLNLPHGGIPIAHDQTAAGSVTLGAMRLEVVFDFRFECGLQQLLRANA